MAENHIFQMFHMQHVLDFSDVSNATGYLLSSTPRISRSQVSVSFFNSLYNPTRVFWGGQDISQVRHSDLFFFTHKMGILVPASNGY